MRAPVGADDEERLASLRKTNLLDTPAEERFDRITRMARRVFGMPVALVSLVDEERQWFKSCQGLPVRETPRDMSFCGHAVHAGETLVVYDAHLDPRFAENPLVVGAPHVRFYAGEPLRDEEGRALGTLCVIDHRPRSFSDEDRRALRDLAALVEEQIHLRDLRRTRISLVAEVDAARRQALLDELTLSWNRRGIDLVLTRELARATRERSAVGVAMIDLDHFKRVNDEHGHPTGDAVLREVAARLRGALRHYDAVGRYGGEEFMAVIPGADYDQVLAVAERMRARVCGTLVPIGGRELAVSVSIGVAFSSEGTDCASDLVAGADEALYRSKRSGRNQVTGTGEELEAWTPTVLPRTA